MDTFLVFRLYGPLAAWGDIAVGEQRPSTPHPSKSAILGLVAAALGIRRHEDARHQALAAGYGFAVQVEAAGVMLRDYHTTQIPDRVKKLRHLATRRDELADGDNLYTVLSSRDYRCDAWYTVCLWLRPRKPQDTHEPPPDLAEVAARLARPLLPLYLGRKSCPLALPVQAQVIPAETFEAALQHFDAKAQTFGLPTRRDSGLYWEDGAPTRQKPLHTVPRYDAPLSRRRRQFGKRDEHYEHYVRGG